MLRTSAVLAIVAGLAMALIKALLAERLWWPFAIVEYLAAGLLLAGAVLAWRNGSGRLLTAGWGVTAGLTWSTLFHHLQDRPAPGALEAGLGLLLAVAALGIALACAPARPSRPRPKMLAGFVLLLASGLAALPAATRAQAQPAGLLGRWLTPNGDAVVEFAPCAAAAPGSICGRIVSLKGEAARGRTDIHNPSPAARNRPILGLEIVRGLSQTKPGVWTVAALYNPDDGRTYTGTLRLREGALELRGCALRIFCQTQTWRRAGASG